MNIDEALNEIVDTLYLLARKLAPDATRDEDRKSVERSELLARQLQRAVGLSPAGAHDRLLEELNERLASAQRQLAAASREVGELRVSVLVAKQKVGVSA